jgi:hypothetical protein
VSQALGQSGIALRQSGLDLRDRRALLLDELPQSFR